MRPREAVAEGRPVADRVRPLRPASRRDDGEAHSITIRDLASEFDVSFRALRFYEGRGLIAPKRVGAKRLYSQRDRERLRTLLLIKRLGFSLMEAKTLIPLFEAAARDPEDAGPLRHRLDEQRRVLVEQRSEIDRALALVPEVLALIGQRQTTAAGGA